MPYRKRGGRRMYRKPWQRKRYYKRKFVKGRVGGTRIRSIVPRNYNVKVHQTVTIMRVAPDAVDIPGQFTVSNQSGTPPDVALRSWKLAPNVALTNIFRTSSSSLGAISMEDIANYGSIFAQVRLNGMAISYIPLVGDDYRLGGGVNAGQFLDPATFICAIDYEDGANASNQTLSSIEQMNKVRRYQGNRRWSYFIRVNQKRGWGAIDPAGVSINDPAQESSKWPSFHFQGFAQQDNNNAGQSPIYGRLLLTAYISLRYRDN